MPVLFSLHATPHPRLWGKPAVKAERAALAGVYDTAGRDILKPDTAAVREALPHYWRKAFDRAGSFWFDKDACIDDAGKAYGGTPYLVLRGSRGQRLGTLYAIPYRFQPA